MGTPDVTPASSAGRLRSRFPLVGLFGALDRWADEPSDERRDAVTGSVADIAGELGLDLIGLSVRAAPLPELDTVVESRTDGMAIELAEPTSGQPIGQVRLYGDADVAAELVRGLEVAITAARDRAAAGRSQRQLTALDAAVRGISSVLDVDRVLQLIVDRVRELVDAQYAALGIVDGDGAIERFITSGITEEQRRRIGDLPHGRGLLGLIIRENRSYRIADIATHPQSYGFPPNHPEMRSFLGLPIPAGTETVGRLYLTNKIGAAEFSVEDERLVEMFALHAGIAIANARLHDQVRRLAVVDERDRISRDLHDSVIQSIYAQTLSLDDVPDLVRDDPDEAAGRVDAAIDALNAVIRDIRNFIFGLRPVLLEAGTLTDGLRYLATELERNGGVDVEFDVADDGGIVGALRIELVAELLAVTRELLSNVARHGGASAATLRLRSDAEWLELEVSDNGRGFVATEAPPGGHHGLANTRARAQGLGGSATITSAPGEGTTIIIRVPHRAHTEEGTA
jgi:signal transduction histidine kinase